MGMGGGQLKKKLQITYSFFECKSSACVQVNVKTLCKGEKIAPVLLDYLSFTLKGQNYQPP